MLWVDHDLWKMLVGEAQASYLSGAVAHLGIAEAAPLETADVNCRAVIVKTLFLDTESLSALVLLYVDPRVAVVFQQFAALVNRLSDKIVFESMEVA